MHPRLLTIDKNLLNHQNFRIKLVDLCKAGESFHSNLSGSEKEKDLVLRSSRPRYRALANSTGRIKVKKHSAQFVLVIICLYLLFTVKYKTMVELPPAKSSV